MKVTLLIVAFYVVLTTANDDRSIIEPRIVGGQKAGIGQFKYQGCLRTRLTKQYLCGAAIISNRFLLTAAHCTDGLYQHTGMIVAVVGAMHRYKDGVTMKVDKITTHNEYNFRLLLHDISLIRTADEIIFSPTVQPIALPKDDLPKNGNARVVLTGWGRISVSNKIRFTRGSYFKKNCAVKLFSFPILMKRMIYNMPKLIQSHSKIAMNVSRAMKI